MQCSVRVVELQCCHVPGGMYLFNTLRSAIFDQCEGGKRLYKSVVYVPLCCQVNESDWLIVVVVLLVKFRIA